MSNINKEKYKIALSLSVGATSGLNFLEDCLYDNKASSNYCIRSINILLSYYVELLLKSRVVMKGCFSNQSELKNKLTELSHNLIKIGKELGSMELSKIGIKEITKNDTKYIIETTNNIKIKTEDFTSIRYDYLFGKQRKTSNSEYAEINSYIEELLKILRHIKKSNEDEKWIK